MCVETHTRTPSSCLPARVCVYSISCDIVFRFFFTVVNDDDDLLYYTLRSRHPRENTQTVAEPVRETPPVHVFEPSSVN
jgi:hypothetical protein